MENRLLETMLGRSALPRGWVFTPMIVVGPDGYVELGRYLTYTPRPGRRWVIERVEFCLSGGQLGELN